MSKQQQAIAAIRIALALVFLYFGFQQALHPNNWASQVPLVLTNSIITATNIIMVNSALELILGTFLLLGLYTRLATLILGLHLVGISFSLGFNPVSVRDFGLAITTLALCWHGPDSYTLDERLTKKKEIQ